MPAILRHDDTYWEFPDRLLGCPSPLDFKPPYLTWGGNTARANRKIDKIITTRSTHPPLLGLIPALSPHLVSLREKSEGLFLPDKSSTTASSILSLSPGPHHQILRFDPIR